MKRLPIRGLLLMTSLAAVECSHSRNNSSGTPQIAVSIRPDAVSMAPAQSVSFSAVVTGSPDTEVGWSVREGLAGGTVSNDGFYTAPAAPGTYHIVATSQRTASQFATAAVMVIDSAVPTDAGSIPSTHVSRDSMGWTIVTSPSDTRVIHVSSSEGSDTNSGGENDPLKTIAAGVKLLRSGFPDWLLLKAGDTWHESFRIAGGGRSEDEPLLVSSYGSGPRPQVQPTINPTLGSSGQAPHVYIIGLDFYDPTKDPSSASFQDGAPDLPGIDWTAGGDDILVEDCSFRFLAGGLNIQGYSMPIMNKVQIRRNLISDMYSNSSFCQGSYFKQITNLLIEENTFDHNAWIVDPKVTPNSNNGPNIYNHHMYLEGSLSGVVVRGNLLLRDSSLSLKFVNYSSQANTTVNVVVDNNFFFEGEVGISVAYGAQGGNLISGSSSSGFTIQNNVLLQMNRDNPTKRGLGWGMQIKSLADSVIKGNIFSDFSYTDNAYAIALIGDDDTFIDSGITIDSNVAYRIHDQAFLVAPRVGWSDNHVTNNTIQDPNLGAAMVSQQGPFAAVSYSGNTYSPSNADNFASIASAPGVSSAQVTYQQWVSQSGETGSKVASPGFPHPELNLDTYVTKLNPAWTVSDFYTAIRTQSKLNWHPEYMASAINDYLRSGFGVAALQRHTNLAPTAAGSLRVRPKKLLQR